jgi:hypothetical protein
MSNETLFDLSMIAHENSQAIDLNNITLESSHLKSHSSTNQPVRSKTSKFKEKITKISSILLPSHSNRLAVALWREFKWRFWREFKWR